MPDTTLIGGPYRASRRIGRKLYCHQRGDVVVAGITDAPIPWPYSKGRGCKPLPVLYGDLIKAVKAESVEAVAHHFGVSRWTVRRWRHLLDVPRFNPGTMAAWKRVAVTKLVHARACKRVTGTPAT
jgi:hypothetical protein